VPTPRVPIDALPAKTAPTGTELLIVQDTGITKKMPISELTVYLAGSIAVPTSASQISATGSGNGVDGTTVQIQLAQLSALAAAGGGGGGTGGDVTDGDHGDITVSGNGAIWMIDPTVISSAARTVLDDVDTAAMRTTLGLGNVNNTADAAKPQFTPTLPGIVPASGGGATNFLRADGLWQAPAGGSGGGTGVTDGDKGDIVVSASGAIWMFDTAVVTPAAKTVLDDTTVAAMRATLGLGNVDNTSDATQDAATSTLTNKTINLSANTVRGTMAQFNTAITDADVPAALNSLVAIWKGTAAEYAAIGAKDPNTLYAVTA
jgi:hypothetical protein